MPLLILSICFFHSVLISLLRKQDDDMNMNIPVLLGRLKQRLLDAIGDFGSEHEAV